MKVNLLAWINLACAAINTGWALRKYPESIDPVSAGLAVFCFGVAILPALTAAEKR